jgi:chromosome segregation ATPase
MRLKSLEIGGFKSFAKKEKLDFESSISAIVGPNGSGKSNIAESFRFVLGEQSMKSMRGKRGEDLIFNGNSKVSRQNKAGVKLIFDNTDKLLKVDFEEVQIERVVHRDGANEYFLNGSKVRLKDIQEILAGANIGASGHHIVSQGDADRILNTSIRERKAMLQDALGLRVFEYKKHEALRKLEKTGDNIKEVESLRREIAPHLRFLKKQVEKIEKAKELQENLKKLYLDYLSRENKYLTAKEKQLTKDIVAPEAELKEINSKIEKIKQSLKQEENSEKQEDKLNLLRIEIGELKSKVAQFDGQISSYETLIKEEENRSDSVIIPKKELDTIYDELGRQREVAESQSNPDVLRKIVTDLFSSIRVFVEKFRGEKTSQLKGELQEKISRLQTDKKALGDRLQALEDDEKEILKQVQNDNKGDSGSQIEVIDLMNRKNELQIQVSEMKNQTQILLNEKEEFKREVSEGIVLIGREISGYESVEVSGDVLEDREEQKKKRKELERMKIRLEEMGGAGGTEIMKEFEEVSERDIFLEKEIEDLKKSSESLNTLIEELTSEIETRFKAGLDKINKEFTKFFSLMFGGGEAKLQIEREKVRGEFEEDEEQYEEGIGIHVNLPRKKIRGLMMLSGGERALTSIALLFAMSAVNPPPFIILDETDAALDEANSKKYGDMILDLAKDSQLILVTHNRETMSRAGIIYGVTMTDGVSQILSIKFDEAVRVAK